MKSSHLFLPPVWAHSEVETSYSPMAVRPRTPPKTASYSGMIFLFYKDNEIFA